MESLGLLGVIEDWFGVDLKQLTVTVPRLSPFPVHSSPSEAWGLWDWGSVRMEHVKRKTKYIDILAVVHTRAEVSTEFWRGIYGRGYGMAVLYFGQ